MFHFNFRTLQNVPVFGLFTFKNSQKVKPHQSLQNSMPFSPTTIIIYIIYFYLNMLHDTLSHNFLKLERTEKQ